MNLEMKHRCRLTGDLLEVVLNLGRQPLGNGFITKEKKEEFFYDLRCGFSPISQLFQIIDQPPPEVMFHDAYAFHSGTSTRMSHHFKMLSDAIADKEDLSDTSFVVEIGCNDGIFLKHVSERGIPHLGVEPARDVADLAERSGVNVLRSFFNFDTAQRIIQDHGRASVVVAANVMCHIPDIRGLAEAVAALLKPEGVLIFEDPYLGDVLRLGSYDQIYDEHVFLFSALSVSKIFAEVGLELVDVEPQPTHGGSMRYTLAASGRRPKTTAVDTVIAEELRQGLDRTETFYTFAQRVATSAKALSYTLEDLRSKNKKIGAYGATSKSTTIYNYAKIDRSLISCIFDNSASKIGKLTPGMHIPIVDESKFALDPPDVTFLAAWNHEREILDRYPSYAESGGLWLTHLPSVRFV